ncbi:MAG: type II toxin-antitoxin system PemK/MazF family toxin [Patescibacteria group bacterium]
MKRFLEWIKIKEFLHLKKNPPGFNEQEIWWANIGENIGHEEDGKDVRFVRPFIIIKKFNKDLLFGIPCSSVLKENKYYYRVNVETSDFETAALLSQARTISSKRLVRIIDKIGSGSFGELKTALIKAVFG